MKDDGFIDLSQEGRYWRWHRLSAPILLLLLAGHVWGRFVRPDNGLVNAPVYLGALALFAIFHAVVGIRHLVRLCPILWPKPGRRHFMAWSVAAERWCGLALAGFLVMHLGLVGLQASMLPDLDQMLHVHAGGPVHLIEAGLAAILVFHGIGGIRVLVQEGLNTHRYDRILAKTALGSALFVLLAALLMG